jgi:hypothetical protein
MIEKCKNDLIIIKVRKQEYNYINKIQIETNFPTIMQVFWRPQVNETISKMIAYQIQMSLQRSQVEKAIEEATVRRSEAAKY